MKIKVNELCIGSMLKTNEGQIIRVETISSKRQRRKIGYHKPEFPNKMYYVRLDQCEPILIDQKFYEENNGSLPCLLAKSDNGESWIAVFKYASIKISYVHQFQVLLVLFGYANESKNLIIPKDNKQE